MRLIYILQWKDKEAQRWFNETAFSSYYKALQAKREAESKDGDEFIYKVIQVPFEE